MRRLGGLGRRPSGRALSDGSDRSDTARRAALQAQISSSEPDGAAFGDAPMPRAGTGLAADVDALLGAANEAQDKTGLDTSQIIHDYWLVRSLHGVAAKLGSAGEMARRSNDGRRTPVGRWAFGCRTAPRQRLRQHRSVHQRDQRQRSAASRLHRRSERHRMGRRPLVRRSTHRRPAPRHIDHRNHKATQRVALNAMAVVLCQRGVRQRMALSKLCSPSVR